jgi:PhoH-like ATPase
VLALAAALELTLERRTAKRIMVFRPIMPVGGQDLGYLPGTEEEKMNPWAAAVFDALRAITTDEVIDEVRSRDLLEILPLTHLRGRTLGPNTVVILDESQNLERSTILTAITRLGEGSRIMLLHDVAQRDTLRVGRRDGIAAVVERLKGETLFAHIGLTRSERSPVAALASRLLDDDGTL